MTRRISFSKKHIRQRVPADVARLAHQQHGADALLLPEEFCVDHAADIEYDDQLLIMRCQKRDVLLLRLRQLIVARRVCAVPSLAGIARQNIDGRYSRCLRRVALHDRHHIRITIRIREQLHDRGLPVLLHILPDHANICAFRLFAGLIIPVEPGRRGDPDTRIDKPLLNVHHRSRIDIAGPGAALHGVARAVSKQRRLLHARKRQAVLVFQQDHALRRDPSDPRHISDLPL